MTQEEVRNEITRLVNNNLSYRKAQNMIVWLDSIGFFEAPASSKYHGAYPGGLAEHSLSVALNLRDLTSKMKLKWIGGRRSPIMVGILHDVCKVDQYEPVDGGGYVYKTDSIFSHHAERSIAMILGSGCISMNEEEVACIRWHMGAYEKDANEWKYLNNAIHKYPNVFWTHVADMEASQLQGV